MRKVLLALDGGKPAEELLRRGGFLPSGEALDLLLVHCLDLNRLAAPGASGFDHLVKSNHQRGQAYLDEQVQELRDLGYALVRGALILGNPRQGILDTARREMVDLIVLATHGRSGLQWLFMGSVAEGVIRRSTCPVLVLPASDAHPEEDL